MDLIKEVKNRQMEILAEATVKTNENLDFNKEIKKIIDTIESFNDAYEAGGKVIFQISEAKIKALVDEIIEATKNYPTEEVILEVSSEETNYSSINVYKLENGKCESYTIASTYIRSEDSLDPPLKARPLLDEAIKYFKKIDVDVNNHSPHRYTIELEGEEYKLVVTKEPIEEPIDPLVGSITYRVDKVFTKEPTYKWEEWTGELPLKSQPLLGEAKRIFKKLDVDETESTHFTCKHTIELEGDKYKLVVIKEPTFEVDHSFRIDKVFTKKPTYKWKEWTGELPF